MSNSSLIVPIDCLSCSIRRLRINSCNDRITVSVLDLKPSNLRASSSNDSGISRVVRIINTLKYMHWDVNDYVFFMYIIIKVSCTCGDRAPKQAEGNGSFRMGISFNTLL